MEVNGAAGTSQTVNFVEPDSIGFAGLTADTFLELMISQLQNQDPLDPMENDELLSQLSMMRNLQANIELGEAMEAITAGQEALIASQRLTSAASFIGRSITGTNTLLESVTGVVDRAFVQNGAAFVGVGEDEVALANVTSVNLAEP